MVEFETNGINGHVVVKLPTSLDEITPEYLSEVTKTIKVSDNYSIIGLCFREKLSTVVMSIKQNKNQMNSAVVPIFIRKGNCVNSTFDANVGEKLIIAPSQLSLAYHVNIPQNTLTVNNLVKYVEGDGNAYKNAAGANVYVYFLEFKIVPNCDIVGVYSNEKVDIKNPFSATKVD